MTFNRVIKMVIWRYGTDKSEEDREDYEQECRIALLKNEKQISELEGISELRATKLAYIICRNAVINYCRKESTERALYDDEVWEQAEKNTYEQEIDGKLDLEKIVQYVDKMKEPYREILLRRFGLKGPPESLTEIGEILGMPRSTVEYKEKQGLAILKKRFK
jgi:RNA polymerase sigma factor (sigma-70 family)